MVCLGKKKRGLGNHASDHALNCRRVTVEGGRDAASQPPPIPPSQTPLSGGALVLADPPPPSSPISPSTLSAVAAARALGVGPVTVLVAGAGPGVGAAASALAASPGVDAVLTADDPRLAHALAEPTAALLAAVTEARGFAATIAPASSAGRDVLPRAAALACRDAVTDVVSVTPDGAFVRPTYAGAVLETVAYVDGGTRWLTVRTAAFPVAGGGGGRRRAPPPPLCPWKKQSSTQRAPPRQAPPLSPTPGAAVAAAGQTWAPRASSSRAAARSAPRPPSPPRWAAWPTAWAAPWAPPAPPSTAASPPTSCRWGRRGGLLLPMCTSRSASAALPSTWRG